MDSAWRLPDAGDLRGQVAVVTGATSGLGLETAKALASLGATVVLAGRNPAKTALAQAEVAGGAPAATVETLALDLTSLAAVRRGAGELGGRHPAVSLLVNNAGIMATPLVRTEDGFESQIGTNHLGHHAFTALVLPMLMAAEGRVVTVSSVGHRWGRVDVEDLNWQRRRYQRWPAYFQSKLANLLFAFELDRLLRASDLPVTSLAAHPGGSATHLGTGAAGVQGRVQGVLLGAMAPLLMSADRGALPQLRAGLDESLGGGTYVGPDGPGEYRGKPVVVTARAKAYDRDKARALWRRSDELTGASWPW
jgi:NAD(P)-dependent dehydrogenase (short-subunit alcohol dehydrogenase family)